MYDVGELTGVADPVSSFDMPRRFQALALVCMCASGVVSRLSHGRLVAGQHQPLLRQLVGLGVLLKPHVPLVYAHFA